jgi:cell wall assembly regulator SMI1
MQKFTRALTREVEVAGVALGVTLDDKGLSFQPADAQQPALTLSWAGCLCAAAGMPSASSKPSAAEVTRALEALRGQPGGADGAAKGDPPASVPDSPGVAALLARLEAWLKKRRRRYYRGLRPGATDEELAALTQALGRPVPDPLAVWLRWHNGQDEDLIGAFVESFLLMSTTDIAAAVRDRKQDRRWESAWVPILDDTQGDLVVLDTSREGLPVRELWEGRDDVVAAAASFEAWLTTLVDDVEAGRYHEGPERGDFMRSRDG